MMTPDSPTCSAERHRLCFTPRTGGADVLAFACDADGRVDLDGLDRRERLEYLYARALIGRDFAAPRVVALRGSER